MGSLCPSRSDNDALERLRGSETSSGYIAQANDRMVANCPIQLLSLYRWEGQKSTQKNPLHCAADFPYKKKRDREK